jgi:hypothetical protein
MPIKSYCMPMLMYCSKTQTWTTLDNGSRCKYRRKTKGKQKKRMENLKLNILDGKLTL